MAEKPKGLPKDPEERRKMLFELPPSKTKFSETALGKQVVEELKAYNLPKGEPLSRMFFRPVEDEEDG